MTREDLIEKYVSAHAECRWKDAGDLDDLLHSFVNELDSLGLPEGLEEAAVRAVTGFPPVVVNGEYYYIRKQMFDIFEAGAKWMAEQGESFVSKVLVNGMNESHVDGYYLDEKIPEGTDVIVQIRKK